MLLPERVTVVEVAPRDGLQNENSIISVENKLEFIGLLSQSGLGVIEITSCVPAAWVPQLADHSEIIARRPEGETIRYPVLVPNLKGLTIAVGAGAKEISAISSASESFARKNSNCTVEEGLQRCREILHTADSLGIGVRTYISCALGCPYEGQVSTSRVSGIAQLLYDYGCREIVLSDTTGSATAGQVRRLIEAVSARVPVENLAVHFHDTYGQALANILAALQEGVAIVDGSVSGLGGCPYAPGAAGNVATEDLVYMLNGLGIVTGVNLERLIAAGIMICRLLGKRNGSRVASALQGNCPDGTK